MTEEGSEGSGRAVRAPSVPGFEDLERIGRGGFSMVYRAYQPEYDRLVAIKVLDLAMSEPDEMDRFTRECRLMGRLGGHPHVLTLHDSGVLDDDRPYLVMEYLEGGSLDAAKPLPQAEVLRVGILIGSALAAVHHAGVLHRDVKPQNILRSGFDQPVLADFGVSALVRQTGDVTGTQALSPLYAAPEAFEKRSVRASDQFSLGASLYALLTGRSPFGEPDESLHRILARVVEEEPEPPPDEICAPSLWAVVQRTLDKEVVDRFPSVNDVVAALQDVQRDLGLTLTQAIGSTAATPKDIDTSARVPTGPPLGGDQPSPTREPPRPLRRRSGRVDLRRGEGTLPSAWPDHPGGARRTGTDGPPRTGTDGSPDGEPALDRGVSRPERQPGPPGGGPDPRPENGAGEVHAPDIEATLDPPSDDAAPDPAHRGTVRSSLLPALVLVLVGVVLGLVVLVLLAGQDDDQGATPPTGAPSTTADPSTLDPSVTDLAISPDTGVEFALTWNGNPTRFYRIYSYTDDTSLVGRPTSVRRLRATEATVRVDEGEGRCFFVALDEDVQTLVNAGEAEDEALNRLADHRDGVCVNGATVASSRGG